MYYRRWTRMHLKPGMKYFMKYGVISPKFDKYAYLLQTENPQPLHYVRNPLLKRNRDKDLDTKLINNLFLKYPDLQYEPISQQKFPGQPFNTFSYAYAFINQQKKFIRQGYTTSKAFQLTEEKYHQKMQRKLDQSLLSRNLAFGNRARSFLNVYQQQAEYESRLKTQRTQRELEKYDLKLKFIRQAVKANQGDKSEQDLLDDDALSYERMFYSIKQHNRSIDDNGDMAPVGFKQIIKNDSKERMQFINSLENKFQNLFGSFYQHAATKDRLEGLTDSEIISQIQSSPSKLKRQTKELTEFLESRNIKLSLQNGNIIITGPDSEQLGKLLKSNKYLKIALLADSLNYQKPKYSAVENPTKGGEGAKEIFKKKSILKDNRPDMLSQQDRETVQAAKKKELQLVSNQSLDFHREVYKILQTEEERLLRLEIKYYDMLIAEHDRNKNSVQELEVREPVEKIEKIDVLEQLEQKREEAIQAFRRLKYRLEKRYKNVSADQLLFPEHEQLGQGLRFENQVEFEELLGYLRRKNDDRRLTSLDQSKDNKVNKIIRVLQVSEGSIPEGTVIRQE